MRCCVERVIHGASIAALDSLGGVSLYFALYQCRGVLPSHSGIHGPIFVSRIRQSNARIIRKSCRETLAQIPVEGYQSQSANPAFAVGDYVNGPVGVQDYFIGVPKGFYKVDPSKPLLPLYLPALGMTAYFALLDVGQPKAAETVVICGASGAVGSIAGQIAMLKACHVVGIAVVRKSAKH